MPVRHGSRWRIRWVDEHGRRKSEVYDDYKQAQLEERKRKVEVAEIRRGMRAAAPPEKTFDELCDYWLEKRAPRKRSGKDDKSIIGKHLRPTFGKMRVRDIGVEEGDDYVNDREHLGDKTIANHLTLLTTMLNAATTFKTPWLIKVPKFNKPKVTLFSKDFHYLRTDDEIRRLLAAARDEGEQVFVLYAAASATCRSSRRSCRFFGSGGFVTLYSLVAQQRVPHIRLGARLVRFSRAALRDWIQGRQVLPAADEPADPRKT